MSLYLDSLPERDDEFKKEAAYAARLGEEVENWPQELSSELLKQLPFLSDYELNVNLDRVDTQRGFAFGYADLANKTERPEAEHDEHGMPHIRVPIVVQEKSVKPFSMYLDGDAVLPLTEERVREALFNPGTFDISQTLPRDPSLVEPLMPPTRTGAGYGGEYKMASARPDLLRAIAPTISEKDASSFIQKLSSDATLRVGFKRAGVVDDLIEVFDKTKRASAEERLAFVAESIQPTVVTLHKLPGGDFLVKSASVNALNPQDMQGQAVPAEETGIDPAAAQSMVPGQTVTSVTEPIELEEPFESKLKPVEEFGQYTVVDTMGNKLTGWVFPVTLAWDGAFSKQPIAVFSNGSAYAMQDSIVGELIGKSTALPKEDQPVGEGVFFTTLGANAICTAPITVRSTMAGPDGLPKILAFDAFGQQLSVSFVDGLSSPQRVSDMEYAFPKTWNFMRLNGQTQLQGGGQDMSGEEGMEEGMGGMSDAPKSAKPKAKGGDKKSDKKPAKKDDKGGEKKEKSEKPTVQVNVGEQVKKEKTSAVLFFNGGYNIQGGCGLDKLAAEYRYDMSPVDAEFMLGLLGVDGITAKQKVAECRRKGSVKLAGLKTITLLGERYSESVKTASAILAKLPNLRRDLTKEAAVLEDKDTVNNLLALNFINPENLSEFVSYIPELEETSERLAEMLLYNYLGMNELPEGAIARSMKGLEDVLVGLKNLSETGGASEEE
jgi:hypothetical protein